MYKNRIINVIMWSLFID